MPDHLCVAAGVCAFAPASFHLVRQALSSRGNHIVRNDPLFRRYCVKSVTRSVRCRTLMQPSLRLSWRSADCRPSLRHALPRPQSSAAILRVPCRSHRNHSGGGIDPDEIVGINIPSPAFLRLWAMVAIIECLCIDANISPHRTAVLASIDIYCYSGQNVTIPRDFLGVPQLEQQPQCPIDRRPSQVRR